MLVFRTSSESFHCWDSHYRRTLFFYWYGLDLQSNPPSAQAAIPCCFLCNQTSLVCHQTPPVLQMHARCTASTPKPSPPCVSLCITATLCRTAAVCEVQLAPATRLCTAETLHDTLQLKLTPAVPRAPAAFPFQSTVCGYSTPNQPCCSPGSGGEGGCVCTGFGGLAGQSVGVCGSVCMAVCECGLWLAVAEPLLFCKVMRVLAACHPLTFAGSAACLPASFCSRTHAGNRGMPHSSHPSDTPPSPSWHSSGTAYMAL